MDILKVILGILGIVMFVYGIAFLKEDRQLKKELNRKDDMDVVDEETMKRVRKLANKGVVCSVIAILVNTLLLITRIMNW